jgi:hypothetical protein
MAGSQQHDRTSTNDHFGDVPVKSSLWVLVPKAAASILISILILLAVFWLHFGYVPRFALGIAVFLAALQILAIIGLRFADRTELHATKRPTGGLQDRIGAFWLPACAFGAFFGWVVGGLAGAFPQLTIPFHIAAVFMTIVLPFITMLPNLRYLQARSASIQVPILITVTALPMLLGINSVTFLWHDLIGR